MYFVDSLKRWFYTNNSSAAGSAARIPLLDANGVAVGSDTYNAISEIVRQELGSILNGGTDQTTGITKVPSLVGNALGATTVANLASVLGVPNTGGVSDANAITSTGFYANTTGSTEGHFPSGYGILLHFSTNAYYPYAQFYLNNEGSHLWVRIKDSGGGQWLSWNQIV